MVAAENTSTMRDVREMASYAQDQTTAMIKDYPAVAMLVVFGVGVGVGALLGESIPGSLLPGKASETTFERIGRQLCDSLNIKF